MAFKVIEALFILVVVGGYLILKLSNVPMEGWLFQFSLIFIAIAPFFVGRLVLWLFSKPKAPRNSFNEALGSEEIEHPSFMKIIFVGWLVCGPALYFLYVHTFK